MDNYRNFVAKIRNIFQYTKCFPKKYAINICKLIVCPVHLPTECPIHLPTKCPLPTLPYTKRSVFFSVTTALFGAK